MEPLFLFLWTKSRLLISTGIPGVLALGPRMWAVFHVLTISYSGAHIHIHKREDQARSLGGIFVISVFGDLFSKPEHRRGIYQPTQFKRTCEKAGISLGLFGVESLHAVRMPSVTLWSGSWVLDLLARWNMARNVKLHLSPDLFTDSKYYFLYWLLYVTVSPKKFSKHSLSWLETLLCEEEEGTPWGSGTGWSRGSTWYDENRTGPSVDFSVFHDSLSHIHLYKM